MNKARWFLEEMVKVAYVEWQHDPTSEMRMRCVAGFVNDMAEWTFHHVAWPGKSGSAAEFRAARKIFGPFAIVSDVANGTKHVTLRKTKTRTPIVTNSDQSYLRQYETFDDVEDLNLLQDFDSLSLWIVETDDHKSHAIEPLIDECINMWERFLSQNNV